MSSDFALTRSFAGYGKIGYVYLSSQSFLNRCSDCWDRFDRRFRIYEISDYGETIQTYKRLANDEIIDRMVLAGHGAPDPNVS